MKELCRVDKALFCIFVEILLKVFKQTIAP